MPTGSCGSFDDECDTSGLQPWTCVPAICSGGSCSGTGTSFSMERGCGRDTEGRPCGACGTCASESCAMPSTCDGGTGPTDVPCFDPYPCTDDYWDGSMCVHVPYDDRCPYQPCATGICDPALATDEAKCDVYRQFVRWAHEPSRDAYPSLVGGACARYPLPAS